MISSPLNNILPKKPLINGSSASVTCAGTYCLNQSIRVNPSVKNSPFSTGKYALVMVVPHSNLPASGTVISLIASKKCVTADGSLLMKAIFSFLLTLKVTLSKRVLPSTVFFKFSTFKIWFPTSLSGWKMIPGYLRFEGSISSIVNFSKAFFLEVACLLLDALAENRAMKSISA